MIRQTPYEWWAPVGSRHLLASERCRTLNVVMREYDHDADGPLMMLRGLPQDVLAMVGAIAVEAALIEQVVERILLELAAVSDAVARVALGQLSFSQKWERCWRLVDQAKYDYLRQYLELWLPQAREVMRRRNKVVHSYWHEVIGESDLFYAYGSTALGRASLLCDRQGFMDVYQAVRCVSKRGYLFTQWQRGMITGDELLADEAQK